jgi:hypothetical protein
LRRIEVGVDASLAAMWAIPEAHSIEALARADDCAKSGTGLLSPCLLVPEVTNARHQRLVRRELTLDEAR